MLEMIIKEEIELVQEIANVNAAERVHLRKRQNTGEPIMYISVQCSSQKKGDKTKETHVSSSTGRSGVNQLTLTTFS
jgi:hypothetical protein